MRYGIISDVHANLEALTAVAEALARSEVDRIVCAGDIVGYGADPCGCIDRMRSLGVLTAAGNHDRACIGRLETAYFNDAARAAVEWTSRVLREEDGRYLASLNLVENVGEKFTLVHGTLSSPEEFDYLLDYFAVASSFSLLTRPVGFVGHSHVPIAFYLRPDGNIAYFHKPKIILEKGNKYFVNVGSVGQPRDGDRRAAYAVYDDEAGVVEIKRVEYDVAGAQEKIIRAGLPEFLAQRLAVGG